ncbi:MAG TPA: hypothetical protein VFK23_11525 [Nitrospirota bacterium]|nr:hypothetical protein [Nitrospirota bacterium]
MVELVRVSDIEKKEKLKSYLEEHFKKGKYAEMTQAIGMYSILIDPEHTMSDQSGLYHFVLDLIKDRIRTTKGKGYAAWYTGFPKILDQMVSANQIVTDQAAADVLASQRAGSGPFKSVDDFFFWALDDRRLPLEQIVKYIETTAK